MPAPNPPILTPDRAPLPINASSAREARSLMSLPEAALDEADVALDWARLSLAPARLAAEQKRLAKARKTSIAPSRPAKLPLSLDPDF